jgi:hypothetical protein
MWINRKWAVKDQPDYGDQPVSRNSTNASPTGVKRRSAGGVDNEPSIYVSLLGICVDRTNPFSVSL